MSKVLWNGANFKPSVKTTNFANIKLLNYFKGKTCDTESFDHSPK